MPIKPVGLGAGNKFTVADDGSALTGLDAGALVGEVPLANGGLGTDASALADGLVTKSMGLMSTTTEVTATIQGTHQNGVAMVAAKDAVTQSSVNLAALDLRLEPGDVLAVALRTASSTATISTPLNWHED